jgi:hypothetical protein
MVPARSLYGGSVPDAQQHDLLGVLGKHYEIHPRLGISIVLLGLRHWSDRRHGLVGRDIGQSRNRRCSFKTCGARTLGIYPT